MSEVIIPDLRPGSILFENPNRFHKERFLISIICGVVKNKFGTRSSCISWKVLRNITYSPIIEVANLDRGGQWEVIRQTEVFVNGEFQNFENQIRALCEEIDYETTMEIRLGSELIQVRKDYLKEHKFGITNIPWMELAKYYRESRALTKEEYEKEFNVKAVKTGFDDAYVEEVNHKLDKSPNIHDSEDLQKAMDEYDLLMKKSKPK